jgi:hypothetical protein
METEYTYTCPNCSKECSVVESMIGQSLTCPSCLQEFFATPPASPTPQTLEGAQAGFQLPKKLPFFKSGRRKILEGRYRELMAAGPMEDSAEDELIVLAISLGLAKEEVARIRREHFLEEFGPIQRRMESSFVVTDDDLSAIAEIERRHGFKAKLEGTASLFRAIYLLESAGTLPTPIATNLMLDKDELAYFSISTTWHQPRVHTHGYSGTSVSIPTGIKGVRFRFGGYTPIRAEEMTPLASGILYVTSERLLFNGNTRNTTIILKKIVDGHVYSDSLRVEKSTGKPDLFSMDAGHARYILSLIGALK